MFDVVEKPSLAEVVFQRLRDGILDGQLRSGEKLPAERALAEKLGVNRGAVREGLKRLQQAELVHIRHGGATEIRDWRRHAGLELLPQLLVNRDGGLNIAVAQGIMTLRSQLAPGLAREAAKNAEDAEIIKLQNLCTELRHAPTQEAAQQIADQFWDQLVDASKNLGYRLAFNSLRRTYHNLMPLLSRVLEDEYRDVDSLEHLCLALHKHDPDEAAQYAQQHVQRGHAAIDAILSSLTSAGKQS